MGTCYKVWYVLLFFYNNIEETRAIVSKMWVYYEQKMYYCEKNLQTVRKTCNP
jgi:hypothetical protein